MDRTFNTSTRNGRPDPSIRTYIYDMFSPLNINRHNSRIQTITLHQCLLSQQHGTCSYHLCRWHEHSPQLSPTMAVIFRCSTLSWRESVREAYLNWSFTHSLIIYYPTWLTDVPWKLTVKCSIREPEPSEIKKAHMLLSMNNNSSLMKDNQAHLQISSTKIYRWSQAWYYKMAGFKHLKGPD